MRRTTLITDFDNTLYDWFHMWHQSFSAMLSEIKKISGVAEDVLIPQIRAIHQKYHTSEYAFLIEELPCLKERFSGKNLETVFDDAIHAYRRARRDSLSLYPGVLETLTELKRRDVTVVIYTESLAFYTNYRIRRLGLDEVIDYVFSPPDHELPTSVAGHAADEKAALRHAKHAYIPEGVIKPNPAVLLDIDKDIGRKTGECVYVGDTLMKDIAMAQDAGIFDVFAEYGVVQNQPEYDLLRKVSHWTEADVIREQNISKRDIRPSKTISRFSEILQFFPE